MLVKRSKGPFVAFCQRAHAIHPIHSHDSVERVLPDGAPSVRYGTVWCRHWHLPFFVGGW